MITSITGGRPVQVSREAQFTHDMVVFFVVELVTARHTGAGPTTARLAAIGRYDSGVAGEVADVAGLDESTASTAATLSSTAKATAPRGRRRAEKLKD